LPGCFATFYGVRAEGGIETIAGAHLDIRASRYY
jgi:hypothetical protein